MISPKENSTRCMEGSPRLKGIPGEKAKVRTQGRAALPANLARVNEAARRSCKTRFTALMHHIDVEALRRVFNRQRRKASAGVDGITVEEYEGNLEDKIVQGAVAEVLSAIYEIDFLGYSFRPRLCRGHSCFVGFTPAVSKSAIKAMSATIRGWKLHLWSSSSLEDIARRINPVIRGWLNYYGRYYRSALYPILRQLQHALVRWAMRKYKRLRGHWLKATHWLGRFARREPRLFVSWEFGYRPPAGQ